MTDDLAGQAGVHQTGEIEITEAMLEAGAEILAYYFGGDGESRDDPSREDCEEAARKVLELATRSPQCARVISASDR